MKFFAGMYTIAETVAVPLLGPLLTLLPQRLRAGPLAPIDSYSARDFVITNCLLWITTVVFILIAWKNASVCGWARDEWPWNIPDYPRADKNCDEWPQTFFELMLSEDHGQSSDPGAVSGFAIGMAVLLLVPFALVRLSRKLPGWGEPPASDSTVVGEEHTAESRV